MVGGDTVARSARDAAQLVKQELLAWHTRFSRFLPGSELSSVNEDPRWEVPVSRVMARLADAVVSAGRLSGGLVDATMVGEIERAGYTGELAEPVPLERAMRLAPARKPAARSPRAGWSELEVDLDSGLLRRPPGVRLDSGGIAKGLFADLLSELLSGHPSFALNCAGDLFIGGAEGVVRPILVESPFDGSTLHTFELSRTGVATSGIGRRSWLDDAYRPCHHLLDPSTGRPAFTGIVQVTALAPTALLAEIQAKTALLSGPPRAASLLPHGGAIVFDDGSHQVVEPRREVTLSDLSGFLKQSPTIAREHDMHGSDSQTSAG
jgi:thiamine biosynthesis lipoprotein